MDKKLIIVLGVFLTVALCVAALYSNDSNHEDIPFKSIDDPTVQSQVLESVITNNDLVLTIETTESVAVKPDTVHHSVSYGDSIVTVTIFDYIGQKFHVVVGDSSDVYLFGVTDKKKYDKKNKTVTIINDTSKKTKMTIKLLSSEPDLTTFTEIFEVTNFKKYTPSKDLDFKARSVVRKGGNDVFKTEWFIETNQSYVVNITDYKTIQVKQEVYNNKTGKNETVFVNETVVSGYHDETHYRNVWSDYNKYGTKIPKNTVQKIKVVYHKKAEIGDVHIQTVPVFCGVECDELTWWNTSWNKRVQLNVNNSSVALTDYQLMKNITYDSDMNANFSDLRFVNDSDTGVIPYWNMSKIDSNYANIWLKIPSISTTTGATIWMYYGNSAASSTSNGEDTFALFEDGSDSSLNSSKWTEYYDLNSQTPGTYTSFSGGVLTLNPGTVNAHGSSIVSVATNLPLNAIVTIRMYSTDAGAYPYHAVSYGNGALDTMTHPHWGLNFHNSYTERGLDNRLIKSISGSETDLSDAANGGWGSYNILDFKMEDSEVRVLKNDAAWLIGEGSNLLSGTQQLSISAGKESNGGGNVYIDYIRVRKYTATEPTWGADGAEESNQALSITGYAPTTPITLELTTSQTFNVTTNITSSCKWYLNGSLKQTNSTGATEHAYTNTSLEAGYWNFTAVVNTSTEDASQTWWVTVNPEYDSTDSWAGAYYPLHYVEFIVTNSTGALCGGVSVSAKWTDSSGAPLQIEDITGSNGAAVFNMTQDVRYTMTFIHTEHGINETRVLYPIDSRYYIYINESYTYDPGNVSTELTNYSTTNTSRGWAFHNLTSTDLNSTIGLGMLGQGIVASTAIWVIVGAGGPTTAFAAITAMAALGIVTWILALFCGMTTVALYILGGKIQ